MKRDVARVTLITLIGVSLIFALWLTNGSAKIQPPDRIVVNKHWPAEPLKIVAVKAKRKLDLELGKTFIEDEDWLDGFTVSVLNSYYKTVTTATVSMVFARELATPGTHSPGTCTSARARLLASIKIEIQTR